MLSCYLERYFLFLFKSNECHFLRSFCDTFLATTADFIDLYVVVDDYLSN